MVNITECAKLALYTYHDPGSQGRLHNFLAFRSPLPASKFSPSERTNGIYEVIVNQSIQSKASLNNDFYASCFVKVENRKATGIVMAIRGTVPTRFGNDTADIKGWWKSVFNDHASVVMPHHYTSRAAIFYHQIQRFNNSAKLNLPNSKIYITGHSLGGAIAALLPTKLGFISPAITFNAPGIKDVPGIHDYWHRVINFRSSCDFISALDEPIGPVWDTAVPEHYSEAVNAFSIAREHAANGWSRLDIINDILESVDFLDSVLAQHSMANLLSALTQSSGKDGILNNTYSSLEHLLTNADHRAKLNTPFLPSNSIA